ncbi:glycosyltransferase family 2 protein [Marinilabilia sp.]|uniref:glycosyltransferase family 2 protein n=1 Tax=Marinilabilia sp. TaxID=2021252 RepID=UPI0025C010C5|nr:glycosyltransferase family 2 protein [Marinilabilia sp.]
MSIPISIITVTYHATPLEHLYLWSLAASGLKHSEIILIDNAGQDSFVDKLQQDYPFIKVVHNKENEGFGRACNRGFAMARGDIALFLNPDTIVPEDFEEQILSFFKTHPNCGAMGVKMVDGCGCYLPESKRNFPTPAASLLRFSGLHRLFTSNAQKHQYYARKVPNAQPAKVPVLSGAFMAVSRKAMEATDGFDPGFFMYAEDIDLSVRISKAGMEVWYNPAITAIHFKGETTRRCAKFPSLFYDSMVTFYKKYYSGKHSALTLLTISSFIQLLKFFSRIKQNLRNAFPQKPRNSCVIHPDTSAEIIKKLEKSGFFARISTSMKKQSHLLLSSKEYTPTRLIAFLTTKPNRRINILLLHEESGILYELNDKKDFVRILK